MVLDPIEQARADFEAGEASADGWPERWQAWGQDGFRIYHAEMRALQPAEGPLPWPAVLGLLVVEGAIAEVGAYAERRWPRWRAALVLTPIFLAVAWPAAELRKRLHRAAAARRGVLQVRDAPPEPPRAAVMIVALGGAAATVALRRRGVRHARGTGIAPVLTGTIVREWEIRRRWRGWTPGGRSRSEHV